MNAQLFSFCLFLLWFSVALVALVIGPLAYPKMFDDSSRRPFLGLGAGLLALWHFVKWWGIRQRSRQREFTHEVEAAYQRRSRSKGKEQQKPIVNPEFQFDETPIKIPPPPPPNGTGH